MMKTTKEIAKEFTDMYWSDYDDKDFEEFANTKWHSEEEVKKKLEQLEKNYSSNNIKDIAE